MRPSFNTVGSLAAATLLAVGLSGSAFGQEFKLGQDGLEARPGETIQLDLVVSGGPQFTSAVNFTIAAEGANSQYVTSIDGVNAGDFSTFLIAEHAPNRDTAGKEYRAVIYAASGTTPIDTRTTKKVATIFVALAANAPVGTQIALKLDKVGGNGSGFDPIDTTTKLGLVGISDKDGNSWVPGRDSTPPVLAKDSRPGRVGTTITVVKADVPALADVNFDGSADLISSTGRWQFAQSIPAQSFADRLQEANTSPYTIQVTGTNTYGYLGIKNRSGFTVLPTAADRLLFYTFKAAANKPNPAELAQIRVRASASDGTSALGTVYAEQGSGGAASGSVVIPNNNVAKALTSVLYVPAHVLNETGGKGYSFNFELLSFGRTQDVGSTYSISDFVAEEAAVPAVETGTDLFSPPTLDFTTGTLGWTSQNIGNLASTFSSEGGLTVTPSGGLVITGGADATTGIVPFSFAYGLWQRTNIPEWEIQANKIYRLDYTIASTGTDAGTVPQVRWRIRGGSTNDFTHSFEMSSLGADDAFIPDANGEAYSNYVMFPSELAGQKVSLFFEAYAVAPSIAYTGVTLKNLRIRAYDAPALTHTP